MTSAKFYLQVETAKITTSKDKNKHIRHGFIAQDVQQVLNDLNTKLQAD